MDSKQPQPYPTGYFPLHISVYDHQALVSPKECTNECCENVAQQIIERFIASAKEKYDLHMMSHAQSTSSIQADAMFAVPFPDRENIRIDFNIYASETESEYRDESRFEFRMESAF